MLKPNFEKADGLGISKVNSNQLDFDLVYLGIFVNIAKK